MRIGNMPVAAATVLLFGCGTPTEAPEFVLAELDVSSELMPNPQVLAIVDFLVEFEKGRTLLDLSGLRLDLCDALGRDVDVATPNSLHPEMKDQILSELVRIF